MTTFPSTVTLGHAAVYPARPIPTLHAIPRSVRKPNKRRAGDTLALYTFCCTREEFIDCCEFLALRRIGGATKPADKRPALPRHKAK